MSPSTASTRNGGWRSPGPKRRISLMVVTKGDHSNPTLVVPETVILCLLAVMHCHHHFVLALVKAVYLSHP